MKLLFIHKLMEYILSTFDSINSEDHNLNDLKYIKSSHVLVWQAKNELEKHKIFRRKGK